jgi:class 3 adenylate cyclase/tetratricopeptide (TPR) repeat protein
MGLGSQGRFRLSGTRVVTMLFTDLVSSTEISHRLGEDAAEDFRRGHFRILRDAVSASSGEEVKNLGDGLMVVFDSPSDAIACAVTMQQAVDHHNRRAAERLDLRVGVHTGEVTQEDEDFFGTAVVIAERLCKSAGPGQVLASDVLRLIVGSRGGHTFRELGPLELKGVPEPVNATEVAWEPLAATTITLPHALAMVEVNPFVGRDDEKQKLWDAFKLARGGERQLAFLVGEPGMGKSRLSAEFAREVHAAGATVLYGRCDEESLAPYQPFVEALRHYVSVCPLEELKTQAAPLADDLARLVPDLARRLTDVTVQPTSTDADTDRLRLFDAVQQLLAEAAAEHTVVLVLDDLHWADRPTLQLLRHLLRTEPFPIQIVATYRETDLDRTHPLSTVLADLRREHLFERLHLKGLDADEIVLALERGAGQDIGRRGHRLAEALARATDGNPFFILQILGHLTDTGRIYEQDGVWTFDAQVEDLGIPEGVKEVIGRRVSTLSERANQALGIAAVLGRDFELAILERVSDMTTDELVDGLDEAVRAGIVLETSGAVGSYSFAHALVRETLYEELTATRRVRLHRLVTDVLEELSAGDPDRYVSELAYHLLEAAQVAETEKAIDYARRAAERAVSLLAYEEGARLYERALQALELGKPEDERLRCELLVGKGDAQWKSAGIAGSLVAFQNAVEIARRLDDAELFARAALGIAGPPEQAVSANDQPAPLDEALAMFTGEDSLLKATVLARLATQYPLNESERRGARAREALEMARRLQDERTLAFALRAAMLAAWRPDNVDEELDMAVEVLSLAERTHDKELAVFGHGWRGIHLMHICDMAGVDAEMERVLGLVSELKQPFSEWTTTMWRATRAMLDGRLGESDALATEAFEIGQRAGIDVALGAYVAQLTVIRWLQGRLVELEPLLEATSKQYPDIPAFLCSLALLYGETGRVDDVSRSLEHLSPDRYSALPLDGFWMVGVTRLSEACAQIGDAGHAATLYELLLPYAGRNAVSGGAVSAAGSVSRALGVLATTLGRWDDAERHLRDAIEENESMGARPFVALALHDYATMLLLRADTGDVEKAYELLDRALPIARDVGMPVLETRITSSREAAPADLGDVR